MSTVPTPPCPDVGPYYIRKVSETQPARYWSGDVFVPVKHYGTREEAEADLLAAQNHSFGPIEVVSDAVPAMIQQGHGACGELREAATAVVDLFQAEFVLRWQMLSDDLREAYHATRRALGMHMPPQPQAATESVVAPAPPPSAVQMLLDELDVHQRQFGSCLPPYIWQMAERARTELAKGGKG